MLKFLRRGQKDVATEPGNSVPDEPSTSPAQGDDPAMSGNPAAPDSPNRGVAAEEQKAGLMRRLAQKLSRTGDSLGDSLGRLLLGKKEIDDELLEEIEMQLLVADVGVDTTRRIMARLAESIERDALADSDALYEQLKQELAATLAGSDVPLVVDPHCTPFVVLVVGVNGAGKTTTIGKLARRLQHEGRSVMLAAGDTFRAAAVEQLQAWGERNGIPVIAQQTGADSASVIFDALQSAKSRSIDVLIADTAGRLHNKDNLMEELKKVVRVIGKLDNAAPQEILLVLDATTGQNAIAQAESFRAAVGVTGIAVTKLDGTARGGVLFAISEKLGLPIRFIGVGEQLDDLRPFNAREFVDAIFSGAARG